MFEVILYTLSILGVISTFKWIFSFSRNQELDSLRWNISNLQMRFSALERELSKLRSSSVENKNDVKVDEESVVDSFTKEETNTSEYPKQEIPLENFAETTRENFSQTSTLSIGKFIDEYVVSKIFLWVGGLAIIFSGFFLAKYSIERDLLSPLGRIFATGCFAIVLAVFAEILKYRSKNGAVASILFVASLAVAYGDFYAASEYYTLVESTYAFVGAAIISLIAMLSVSRYGVGMLYLALFGAFLAPAIFSSENPSVLVLVSYLAVSTYVTLKISVQRHGYFQIFILCLANVLWLSTIILSLLTSTNDCIWVLSYLLFFSFVSIVLIRNITVSDIVKTYPSLFDSQDSGAANSFKFFLRYSPIIFSTYAAIFVFTNSNLASTIFSLQLFLTILLLSEIVICKNAIEMKSFTFISALIIPIILTSDLYATVTLAGLGLLSVRNFAKEKSTYYIWLLFVAFLPRVLIRADIDFTSIVTLLIFGSSFIYFYRATKKFNFDNSVVKLVISFATILLSAFIWRSCELSTFIISCGVISVVCCLLARLTKDENFDIGVILTTLFLGVLLLYFYPKNFCYLISSILIFISTFFTRKMSPSSIIGDFTSMLSVLFMVYISAYLVVNSSPDFIQNNFTLCALGVCVSGVIALITSYLGKFEGLSGVRIGAFISLLAMTFFGLLLSLFAYDTSVRIDGEELLNVLFIFLLLPSIFSFIFCGQGAIRNVSIFIGIILLFIFTNLELRFCFQGNVINKISSSAEFYSYSILWLFFGIGLLGVGKRWNAARYMSIVFVLASVVKVFVWDASVLDGILRVMSFGLLGFVLIGIGWGYSKWIFKTDRE